MNKVGMGLIVCLLFSGCHTIRPIASAEPVILNRVSPINSNIQLVLDEDYSSYISKDRGNALADPQTYYVGDALAPLTEAFFSESFDSVDVVEIFDRTDNSNGLVIHPRILKFDNSVKFGGQAVTVALAADIYGPDGQLIESVSAQGTGRGDIGVFKSSHLASKTVSQAIQFALVNLLAEVEKAL